MSVLFYSKGVIIIKKTRRVFSCILIIGIICFGTVIALADYVGSAKSAIYHYRECEWASKISPANQVVFETVEDAISRGYRSCHVCFPPEAGKIERIWIDNPTLSLNVGQFTKLELCYYPENAEDAKDIKVTSSNPKVAVITDGKVYAKSLGSTDICASTPGNVTCKYTISVVPVPVDKISFKESSLTVRSGDVFTPEVKVEPVNTDYKLITWKTSDDEIIKVTKDGRLKAVGSGKCVITANCGGVEESINIIVEKSYTSIVLAGAVVVALIVIAGAFAVTARKRKSNL